MSSTTMTNPLALPTTIDSAALASSLADYNKTLVDNVYNSNIFLNLVNAAGNKRTIDGGLSIVENIIKEKQNAGGFYLGADVLNNTQPNTTTPIEFRWQNVYEPIVITRDEERQNSGASHKIYDLAATKTLQSEKAINERVEEALSISVSEANNLEDVSTLVNTGTLGSIAGATETWWQSTVTASGAFATQGLN